MAIKWKREHYTSNYGFDQCGFFSLEIYLCRIDPTRSHFIVLYFTIGNDVDVYTRWTIKCNFFPSDNHVDFIHHTSDHALFNTLSVVDCCLRFCCCCLFILHWFAFHTSPLFRLHKMLFFIFKQFVSIAQKSAHSLIYSYIIWSVGAEHKQAHQPREPHPMCLPY